MMPNFNPARFIAEAYRVAKLGARKMPNAFRQSEGPETAGKQEIKERLLN